MITVVVPQLRRGENSLFLWHLGDTRQPVHTFVGHTDVVLEFQWRKQTDGGTCCLCFHLVIRDLFRKGPYWFINSVINSVTP